MIAIPLWRRIALAAVALIAAAGLFRGQVASALITRGDDALRSGDRGGVRYYARALKIDPSCLAAADRLAFALAARRRPGDLETAIAVATTAIERTGGDANVLADRGFAEQRLARWAAAEADFGRAGAIARDARYDHLAGRVALRLRDRVAARRFFATALEHDATFRPARVALQGL